MTTEHTQHAQPVDPDAPHKCVSLVKIDGQKINYIDGVGAEVDGFLVIKEEGVSDIRIPLETVSSWVNRDDYVAQAWRWHGK